MIDRETLTSVPILHRGCVMREGDRGTAPYSVLVVTGGSLLLWWALLVKGALVLFTEVSRLWH
jgi:hypothetical protein